MSRAPLVVGIGEALVDLLPDGPVVGGAPLNVLVHARALGCVAALVSRVGADEHGRSILGRLADRGISAAGVQLDEGRATGTVGVELDEAGEPRFGIHEGVAWDHLERESSLTALLGRADAVVFGTLACRSAASREAILGLLQDARGALRLLDLNLRAPFFARRTIEQLLERATALKVNENELRFLCETFSLPHDPLILRERFELDWVAVTGGAEGASLHDGRSAHDVAACPATPGGDAVGAGDGFCAGLLHGSLHGWEWPRSLELAARVGGFVASCRGAQPRLPDELIPPAD